MAGRGRPPTPTEEKRKLGTLRKDRLPGGGAELAIVAALPATMADRTPRDAFEDVMARGVSWLAETDAPAVCLLRSLLEERGELYAAVQFSGGDRKPLRDLDKQIIALLAQLGFDPASRSKLGLAEVRAASKLEALRASQTKRVASSVVDEGHAG